MLREFPHPGIKGEPNQSHPSGVYQLRLTADEKYLVSVGPAPRNQGYLAVWNVADGKLVYGSGTTFGPLFGLALAADGRSVLLGCGPKILKTQDAEAVIVALPVK